MRYLITDQTHATTLRDVMRALYRMARRDQPNDPIVSMNWDTIYKHPTEQKWALEYDETRGYPIDLTKEAQTIVDLLYPNASNAKKQQIRDFINNNDTATMEQILPNNLPSGVEIVDTLTSDWGLE